MFGMINEKQKAEIRTEIEGCVERVFQRHGFRPNQSDTAALHNAMSTKTSCVVDLVATARNAARAVISLPGFSATANDLNLYADRVENLYKATRETGV